VLLEELSICTLDAKASVLSIRLWLPDAGFQPRSNIHSNGLYCQLAEFPRAVIKHAAISSIFPLPMQWFYCPVFFTAPCS